MKKILLIASFLVSLSNFAQISHGGNPISFNKNLGIAPTFTTPTINTQAYIDEDKVTDLHKDIAWRFGIEQFVNLNLANSGAWTTLANSDRVWRLEIKSPNAKTINLNYSNFNLPVGATFFVYNKNQVLGSFIHENNKVNSEFSTTLLLGDNAILEYYEPFTVQGQGIINVSSVVHGYRDLFNHLKGFDDSGSCNINAICDTTDWGNEIRSSVMLLTSGNSRFCSGALVNNTSQDGTPYVLSANHCNPTGSNIFMFNYQSPTCSTNTDGFTTQTISGCTVRANDAPSDFFLVELSSLPPASYNVFYAGWSNINTAPTSATGIHYPVLDVKKISHDTDPLVESGYYMAGNDHWEVLDWNSGTTQGGSSGSPLFDQNHRIVGQLHGGNAACGNDEFDYYGKFSYSWDTDPTNAKQLKFWLDPTNTGDSILDGFDPNGPSLTTDPALLNTSGIASFICGDSISPMISIRNNGSANLTALDINYELDGGGIFVYNWTGNLPSYGIDIINLPTMYVPNGAHTFTVNLSNPNATADENMLNNDASISFNSNEDPTFASLTLNTDNYGSETSWYIKDNATGIITAVSDGYANVTGGETINKNLCLYNGCFTFVLKDAFGDGYCCAFGSGSMYLTEDATGDTLIIENTNSFIGDTLAFTFCLGITEPALLNILNIDTFICGDSISPQISVQNNGSINLISLNINYELDGGGINTFNWTGNIDTAAIDTINIPTINSPNGAHTFTVNISDPNNSTDNNLTNNDASINFNSTTGGISTSLTLNTDNFGSETSWFIRDNSTNNIVTQSNAYSNTTGGETINDNLCLYDGCFTFILKDALGNGYCCAFGNGSVYLTNDLSGDTLIIENTNSFQGDSISFDFCLSSLNAVSEFFNPVFELFPNPTSGIVTIKRNQKTRANIIIYDVLGKIIYSKENEITKEIQLDLTGVNKGIYFVSIISNKERLVRRIVIN